MALRTDEACTACDACWPVRPNDAISIGDLIHAANALACTECGDAEDEPQCKRACPADCIVPNPDFAESPEGLLTKYGALHGGDRAPVRASGSTAAARVQTTCMAAS